MPDRKEPVIHVEHLSKDFDDFTAVDNISFQVQKGEIFGFLGPNGSGKTTTIRMMLGLLRPSQGHVQVLGLPVKERSQDIQPRVGYMSQQFSLYNDLTVIQNLNFYGQSYGLEGELLKDRVQDALQMADLVGYRNTPTKDLSGGWRQRLALSSAILHRPEILFLDEPTAGVDPVSRREFWDLLYAFVEGGITVFITTHYMDEAEHCHRLAFLQRGQIIALGTPEQIKSEVMSGDVLEIASSDAARTIQVLRKSAGKSALDIQDIQLYGSLVHITGRELRRRKRKIKKIIRRAKIEVYSLHSIEPSLEDVFITCMREKGSEVNHES